MSECQGGTSVSTRRYARSPIDGEVHLLAGSDVSGGFQARCSAVIPAGVLQFDQPPFGSPCERCRVSLIEVAASTPQDRRLAVG